MDYVKKFNDRYVNLHMRDDWFGEKYNMNNIDGHIDDILTDYFNDNNIPLNSKSYSAKDNKLDKNKEVQDLESYKEICKQIKNDFPVIIGIGKGKNENDLVPLYIKNDSGAFQYEYAESTDEHYITITGVIIDNIQSSINPDNSIVYRISTWGKNDYYVFASDLYYHLTTGNNLLNDIENHISNNITVIEKR